MNIWKRTLELFTRKKSNSKKVHYCKEEDVITKEVCGSQMIAWEAYVDECGKMIGGGMEDYMCLGCGVVMGKLGSKISERTI